MKTKILAALAAVSIAAGCSSTPEFSTDPEDVTHDGLTRVNRTIMDAVWARKDIDLSGVTGVRFKSLGVEYRNVDGPYSGRAGVGTGRARSSQTEFQLDAATRALFEEEISGAFMEEIRRSTVFEVTDESGPNVVDVHIGLLDVVSRVPPDTVGRSRIFIDRVGEATLVLEIRDSISNTVLVRAVNRRAAQNFTAQESTPPRNRAEVRRLGRRWGQILRDGLEKMIGDGMSTP
ncbi:MAG: DUF3313 family protein [Woeseiaceae bacterium]|nr:DUF3313 family protein [Woeseiaceae bacterium]